MISYLYIENLGILSKSIYIKVLKLENKVEYTSAFIKSIEDLDEKNKNEINDFVNNPSISDSRVSKVNFHITHFLYKISGFYIVFTQAFDGSLCFRYLLDDFNDIYNINVEWYDVYQIVARLLSRTHEVNNGLYDELIGILYSEEFVDNNLWVNDLNSIDPIHIFISFNSQNLRYDKRVKRINYIIKRLYKYLDNIEVNIISNINFMGCPVIFSNRALTSRPKWLEDIIWELHIDAEKHGRVNFDNIHSTYRVYGLSERVITTYLFLINSRNFVPLDKKTVRILSSLNYSDDIKSLVSEYENITREKNTNKYRDWVLLGLGLSAKNESNNLLSVESKKKHIKEDVRASRFNLIAIKPLSNCSSDFRKTLDENKLYVFNDAYEFDLNSIVYNDKKNCSLYNLDNVDINIHAIVGKNGSGKSTLIELFYAIINNAYSSLGNSGKFAIGVHAEVYFDIDYLYKIKVQNENVEIIKYIDTNGKYDLNNGVRLNLKDMKDFFYTIVVNYSQHSLNTCNVGDGEDWLAKLFHKNDAYQTPIVIEPYRKKGNIDINKQDKLVKQRLVSNLLEVESKDDNESSHRKITELYSAEKFRFKLDLSKFDRVNDKIEFSLIEGITPHIINKVRCKFDINRRELAKKSPNDCKTLIDYSEVYLVKKLINMAITYQNYNEFYDEVKNDFLNIDEYLNKLSTDFSHITFKFYKTISFIKYWSTIIKIEKVDDYFDLNIEEYSKRSLDVLKNNDNLNIVHVSPPSYFNVDVILTNDIKFKHLSSGEKQKIYSLNSIYYHLKNISSVNDEYIKYRNVTIILDEIELYFHPELQRNYIIDLLSGLRKLDLSNINSINIIFVTHSPFIISDIPDGNVLFLSNNRTNDTNFMDNNKIKTFGANIHELLMSGFFMDSSIGGFALSKIKEIIDFHNQIIECRSSDISNFKNRFKQNEMYFEYIVNMVGEPYVKSILKNHMEDIKDRLEFDFSNDSKIRKINELKMELEALEGSLNDTD